MVDDSILDLKYGHFGPSTYDTENSSWNFSRDLGRTHEIRVAGNFKPILKATRPWDAEGTVRDEAEQQQQRYTRQLEFGVSHLVRTHPELAPARELLSTLHRVSEAVSMAVAGYDPTNGRLIAHGYVFADGHENHSKRVQLLAVPGGLNGDALRLVRLRKQSCGWPSGGSLLHSPSPVNEVGWWVGKGAPIKQICFAEPLRENDRTSMLAVRLSGCIIILNPRYHLNVVPPAGVSVDCIHPPSRIGANVMFEITPASFQGEAFADVSFNPWDHKKFAVVDHNGKWAIFHIGRLDEKSKLRVPTLIRKGQIKDQPFTNVPGVLSTEDAFRGDGWARILWSGNRHSIIICTRLHIASFNFINKITSELVLPRTQGLPRSCHLDLVRCPNRPHWIFLLTTEQLLWIDVSETVDDLTDNRSNRARVILCTRHFRSPSDITLSMEVIDDEEGAQLSLSTHNICSQFIDILVTVSSAKNQAVSTFRFVTTDDMGTAPAWACDPGQLVITVDTMRSSILDFSIRRLKYDGDEGSRRPQTQPRFYSLQILTRDLAIRQTFLYTNPNAQRHISMAEPLGKGYDVQLANLFNQFGAQDNRFANGDDLTPKKPIPIYQDAIVARRPSFKVTYRNINEDRIERVMRGPTVDMSAVIEQVTSTVPSGLDTAPVKDVVDVASHLKELLLSGEHQNLGEPAKTL
jgi:RNA polymerase I-specific transcription initiation factor RRN6